MNTKLERIQTKIYQYLGKIDKLLSTLLIFMNPLRNHPRFWRQIYRLFHHPNLGYGLNLRANTASISFITCSLPFFLFGQVTIGIALSLGSVACGLADTASVKRHRVTDTLISIVLFFCNSLAVLLLFDDTITFAIYLGVSSFLLLMLALYSPRLGAIGFATVLLGVYAMILHTPHENLWHLSISLALGAVWYGLWQWLTTKFFPERENEDLVYEIYQSLAKKLLSHAWPLTHSGEYDTFVETARLRAKYANKFTVLDQRVHQQLAAGESNTNIGKILNAMKVAESVSEQTRLMHFTPSFAFQEAHGNWLASIDLVTRQLSKSLKEFKTTQMSLVLPHIDFKWLRHAPQDDNFRRELLLAMGFIDKLELIYISLKELNGQAVEIYSPHQQKQPKSRVSFSQFKLTTKLQWNKFFSQFTLKSSYFRHAIRGSLCLTIGLLLVRGLNLEFGFWTLMTSLLVLKPNLSMTWSRLLHRLGGTLSGLALVSLMLHWQVHDMVLILTFCAASIGFFHTTARQYGISVFFVTLFVFSGFALNGQGHEILLPRLENTFLGVALPVIFVLLIAPGWHKHAFPNQLLTTMRSYFSYLKGLQALLTVVEDNNGKSSQEIYQSCVRNDTNLFDHWLGYLMEPRTQSKTSEAILLCCHSSNIMLRLITLLHQQKINPSEETQQRLMLTIEAFENLLAGIERIHRSPQFFDYLSDHKAQITPTLKEIERQSEQLSSSRILDLLTKEVIILSGKQFTKSADTPLATNQKPV